MSDSAKVESTGESTVEGTGFATGIAPNVNSWVEDDFDEGEPISSVMTSDSVISMTGYSTSMGYKFNPNKKKNESNHTLRLRERVMDSVTGSYR